MFLEVLFSFFITASFAYLFNVRGKYIIYSAVGGAISWFFYLLFKEMHFTYSTCYLLATALTALYCEIMGKLTKTTVTNLLVAALIPMAPGGGVYYTMFYLVKNDYENFILKGIETSVIAGSMALGIIVVSTFGRLYRQKIK